jgi:predicted O-methyltransferase YrrM
MDHQAQNAVEELNLNGAWSITEAGFSEIVRHMKKKVSTPEVIVEFGSGRSSIRLAQSFPSAKIISIENDPLSFQSTTSLAQKFVKSEQLTVHHKELEMRTYGNSELLSYAPTPELESEKIDCVIVDGPSFYTLRGREACLYQVYSQLKVGGLVFLDDFKRSDEKRIVKNWLKVYSESFKLEISEVGHHLAILQKVKSVPEKWDNAVKMADNRLVAKKYQKIKWGLLQLEDQSVNSILKFLKNFGVNAEEAAYVLTSMRKSYGISAPTCEIHHLNKNPRSIVNHWGDRLKNAQAYEELMRIFVKGSLNW